MLDRRSRVSRRTFLAKLRIEALENRQLLAADLGFVPLPASVAVGSLPEEAPFSLPAGFTQTIVETQATLGPGESMPVGSTGNSWADMLTLNETGPQPGRYLFRAHELFTSLGGNAGISRTDLVTGETVTIAQQADYDAFDPAFWSPWQTVLTGEESAGDGNIPSIDFPEAENGLIYEILNPIEEDSALIVTVPRPAVGSMAHEGIQFDADGNVYVVDEFNGGGIYKFVPSSWGDLGSGQLFVLRDLDLNGAVDAGHNRVNDLGEAAWVPLNDEIGLPIDGVTDPTIDGRQAADDVNASNYLRPEDLQISRLANGNEVLYVATTTDDRVLSIELAGDTPVVREFVTRATPEGSAIGPAVSTPFNNPDNLAVDRWGRIFIVEDDAAGDIWGTVDADNNGVADYVGRFASLSTVGAEPTGLYFNPFDPNEMFVNVQHASSGSDGTFMIRREGVASTAAIVLGTLSITGTDGADKIQVDPSGDLLTVRVNGAVLGSFAASDVSAIRVSALGGNDQVRLAPAIELASFLIGGNGNDVLYGARGEDLLDGGDGNDLAFGFDGDDQIYGGAGRDLLSGGNGDDRIWGGLGTDVLYGQAGDDELDGGDGFDWLLGGLGFDFLLNGERNSE